jgi:hypothetical protein
MTENAKLKLELRLVPTEGEANAALFDDMIRLIKQGIVTAPEGVPQMNTSGEFHPSTDNSQEKLATKIRHRIDQATESSRAAVEKRKEVAVQPDGEEKLAAESLEAAEGLISAVQRAIIRGVAVQVADDKDASNSS